MAATLVQLRRISETGRLCSKVLFMKQYTKNVPRRYCTIQKDISFDKRKDQLLKGNLSIELTHDELSLINMLTEVKKEFHLSTNIRIAGGWVRDRLLGLEGKDDIDIALDNMTGSEFSAYMDQWNDKYGLEQIRFAIIQQNPDKSKHLETGKE